MARTRLSDEEREARRKARSRKSFSDAAYKHYEPKTEGFGSRSEWTNTAHERLGVSLATHVAIDADLAILGLGSMPDAAALLSAYRKRSKYAHPDAGGSDEEFVALREAYDRLKAKVGGSRR